VERTSRRCGLEGQQFLEQRRIQTTAKVGEQRV
jgi:hypothetical protein